MAESKPIRILYMEDDPNLARLIQKQLERAGYIADLAYDGEEGLVMYAAGSYDVVAVDQNMPVYDGLEVIRIMASQGPLPPTIMVTGTGSEQIAVEAMKLGAQDYIVKDMDGGYFDLLPTVIEQALQQQRLAEEKQRAEEALLRLEMAVEQSIDGIAVADMDGNIQFVNPAWAQMHGRSREELLGKHLNIFHTEEQLQKEVIPFNRRVIEVGAHQGEVGHVRKDGTTFPTWMTVALLKDGKGNPAGLVGTARDITERKRAEETLRRERDFAEGLVETAQVIVLVLDTEGRIVRFNPYMEEISGYQLEEVQGKDWFTTFLPKRDHRRIREMFSEAVSDTQTLGNVNPIVTKDGREREIEWYDKTLKDADGNITGLLAVGQDITARKRAEEQLQRYAAELEQANEEVRQFAYTISHDLRAPLVNLKGFAAELRSALGVIGSAMVTALPHLERKQQQAVATALQEDIPEALGFIDSSATRMDRFISALLKLSRLGRRELYLEPIDMEALVQVTLETLAHQIEERQVAVTVGLLPEVVADRTSMEQIMGNLLTNAILYLDPDRPGEIEISGERDRDETTFRIRDNGRGIAEEDMDKVFAPFRRAGKQDVPGEGMGLPYVQTLARRHGGRIWCESQQGVGTTFTFTLSNHLAEGGDHV